MKTTTSQHGERCLWRRNWSVGIATALLAAAPFVASAQSNGTTGDGNSTSSYEGVGDLPGETFEELQKGITADCSYGDPSKVYFLYNVGSGKFLNMGGYWGTSASLKDYPMPLWTRNGTSTKIDGSETPSLNFAQNIATREGNMVKWVNGGTNGTTDVGVFCDRGPTTNLNGYDGWFFTKTTDSNVRTPTLSTLSRLLRQVLGSAHKMGYTLRPLTKDKLQQTGTVEQIHTRISAPTVHLTIIANGASSRYRTSTTCS